MMFIMTWLAKLWHGPEQWEEYERRQKQPRIKHKPRRRRK
jgi:hypothetical protein